MITRDMNADRLNLIANHPDVFKWVSVPGIGYLDASAIAEDPKNYVLMTDGGGVFYHSHGNGIYEAHSQYLPDARGKFALDTTRETIDWMFTHTDCERIITAVPKGNLAAAVLAKACGLRFSFEQADAWPKDDELIPVRWFALNKADWKR